MAQNILTLTKLKQLKPRASEFLEADGGNLYLLIKPNGSMIWRFIYSHPSKQKRPKKSLGKYPIVSLAEAREIAQGYNKLLSQGLDPFEHLEQQEAERAKAEITLREFADKWRQIKLSTQENKPSTMKKEWGRLEKHLFPIFGDVPLSQIQPNIFIERYSALYEVKGDTVEKIAGRLIDMLNLAINLGIIKNHNLATVRKVFTRKKDKQNPTIKAEALPDLFRCLSVANNFVTSKLLIEWQMLTMLRPAEAVAVEWSEIDWQNKILHLPAEKMKGTIKNAKSHSVPLSSQALALLNIMKKHNGHKRHVFAHRLRDDEPCNSQTANSVLKRNGYKGKLTAHGLRAMARTYLADKGVDFQVAESCLAHLVGNSVSQRYNHSNYLEQRREVMQMWGDFVEQCKKG